ncbi:MAG: DUF1570 domain-containing protein [Planctomycetes bacterium]|nr:DUF1570 domain-containing protein [Planctomycetota bacterium]
MGRLLILALLAAAALGAPALAQDDPRTVFETELERVRVKMDRGDWATAQRRLQRLLEANARESFVLEELGAVELMMQRCVFWRDHGAVDLSQGLVGEFEYDLATGRVSLHYAAEAPNDFESRGGWLVLPVEFDGPYSVELVDGPEPQVFVCSDGDQYVSASFSRVFHLGRGNPGQNKPTERTLSVRARLREADGDLLDETTSKEFTSKRDLDERRYEVEVSGTSVKCSFNGKSLLTRTKPAELWGHVAFALTIPKSELRVEGQARTWLQHRLDEAVDGDWKRFVAEWKLAPYLPAELAAALAAQERAAPPVAPAELSPARLPQADVVEWNEIVARLNALDLEAGLARLEPLLARHPALAEGHRARAGALLLLRRPDEACAAYAEAVRHAPAREELRREQAETLLRCGRFAEALDAVAAAVAAGFPATHFQDVSVTANKALHGPPWNQKFEYDSRHFSVASDQSRELCRGIALELEENFRHVSRRLSLGEHAEDRKFQVYVFSGPNRYAEYVADVFGGTGENTLGMYSPFLEQLLVLDSSDREALMHTVRHEGFHQLIDSELDAPPTWLNEGLAEYFAAARTADGWKDGQLNEPRLAALRRIREHVPLATFLYQDQPAFLRDAQRCYAQAWLLVHYLLNSTQENARVLDTLLAELRAGRSNREAVETAFAGIDLAALDAALLRFRDGL